jgi:hypothetical protein
MEDKSLVRLVDKRLRNGIMDAVLILADGDDGVRRVSPTEYFEIFYDFIPHRDDREMWPNSAIAADERALLLEVSGIVDAACNATCNATPDEMTAEEFIATGWPKRIQPLALKALNLMRERGRFKE